jgi:hypothetical protein
VEGRRGRPSSDRRAARWWREERRTRIAEEADRARARKLLCDWYGLTPAEHDSLTFEELEIWHQEMSGGGDEVD